MRTLFMAAVAAVLLTTGSAVCAEDFQALCKAGSVRMPVPDAEKLCICLAKHITAADLASVLGALTIRATIANGGKPDYSQLPPDYQKGIAAIGQATGLCIADFSH